MSYQRSKEDERRLKKTYEMTKNSYGPGVWYSERKNRYIKANFTNKRISWYNKKRNKQSEFSMILNNGMLKFISMYIKH